jgi:predicted nucleotide-binding protein
MIRQPGGQVDEFARREHAISVLMNQSESRLDAFFFSLGLGPAFHGPASGWGRQKRIVSALMAAEERGDISAILDLINKTFSSGESASPKMGMATELPTPAQRPSADPARAGSITIDDSITSVFVVHGHDRELREQVARFIERVGAGNLEPVILAEQPARGQTLIENFESHASVAGYAIILLTPDDQAGQGSNDDRNPRARQNVILELGYFVGVLGRKRIAVLRRGDVEVPSDVAGVIFIEVDDEGAWKHKLAREMREAGLPIDFSRIV